jgi:hypothetical protein
LEARGQYSPIKPDSRGHLLCRATRLRFLIEDDRVRVIDDRTDQPLLYSDEEEALRRAAEDAHKAAEAEIVRLREELERLKGKTSS